MMTDLDTWLDFEAERWRLLVEHPDGMPTRFDELCRQTAKAVPMNNYRPRWDEPGFPGSLTPGSLTEEWLDYLEFWPKFLMRNPRIRIAAMLGEISRSHDGTAWPVNPTWTMELRDWTRSAFRTLRPFDDNGGIDTGEFRQELWDAAQRAGQGWVLWEPSSEAFLWIEDRHVK